MKRNAYKKTSKYKKISKLQAVIKGWLFRNRRKKLIEKVKLISEEETAGIDDLDMAEDFFGKQPDFLGQTEEEDLMLKAIEIMAATS